MTYGNNWEEYYQGYAQNGTDPKQLEEWFRRLYQSGGISGDLLAEKSIVGYLHIRDASITAATIRDAAINTAHIQDASITTAKILDAAITSAKIQDAAINTAKIEDAAITSAKIANAAIESAHISEAAIHSAHIMYGAIQSAHIAEASIDRTKIMDGEIVSAKIADAAITSAKIADAAITTAKIAFGAITTALIEDAAITTAKIQDASITSAKIAELSVGTAQIIDAAITTAKIADAAITSAKIGNAQIQNAHIATAAIDSSKIQTASITTGLIADGAITSAKIQQAAIGEAHIADASITDAKIANISANKINAGTINTGLVTLSGPNSKLKITGNRIQVFDNQATPVERVSLGDVNGDGSVFGFRVRGADGQTVLMDENGVRSEGITDGAITNPKIASGAVGTDELQDGSVTNAKVANASIDTAKIKVGAITTALIADAAITSAKIQQAAISTAHIADAAITSAKIGEAQITSAHIVAGSIGTAEIADAAITTAKIANAAITSALIGQAQIENTHIKDATITGAKIANATITGAKIADAAITTAKIADAAITNAKISSLDASKITSGYINADRIAAGSITAEKMVIGDFTNLCVNPDFLGGKSDKWSGGVIAAIDSEAAEVPAGAPTAYVGKQINRDGYCGDPFPVKPGDKFYVEFTAATGNSTYPFTVGLQFFDASGATITWARSNYLDPTSDWKTQSGTVTAPSGAVTARVWSQINGPAGSTNTWYFSRVIVRRMAAGELIVDGSITANKLSVSSLSAISANLGTVTAGTLTGVTLRSDDGKGNSVSIENGSVISKINNRNMVEINNYNIYFYDSGKNDPTPDYSEAGRIGSSWSLSDTEFRGLSVIGSKDFLSIDRSTGESKSAVWARFDFKNRVTEIYGGDETTDSGKLYLYSTFEGGTANGKVPAIEIRNYTSSNGTPWSGVFVLTGRDNRSPKDDNFRSGFEVWQYMGTQNGAEKQMLKIDTKSSGASYTSIYTDEAWLPWQTRIEAKNGLYYYPCLINVSSNITDIHGNYDGPVAVYVGRTTIDIKASENYAYKRMTFSWTENIFFAIAQPYGPYSVYTNARVYNQSSTGFDIYLAWNSDANRTDRTVEVRFLVLLEAA